MAFQSEAGHTFLGVLFTKIIYEMICKISIDKYETDATMCARCRFAGSPQGWRSVIRTRSYPKGRKCVPLVALLSRDFFLHVIPDKDSAPGYQIRIVTCAAGRRPAYGDLGSASKAPRKKNGV